MEKVKIGRLIKTNWSVRFAGSSYFVLRDTNGGGWRGGARVSVSAPQFAAFHNVMRCFISWKNSVFKISILTVSMRHVHPLKHTLPQLSLAGGDFKVCAASGPK